MPKLAALLALAFGLIGAPAAFAQDVAQSVAQGVAPGGPIGGSTGIGSGLGGVHGGTGPSWPNGTTQPTLQPPPPPGGLSPPGPSPAPPAESTGRPSYYPQPRAPFDAPPRAATVPPGSVPPATVPLALPDRPTGDLAFLKGCWRSDVFRSAGHSGTTTWCFDAQGVGRFLYARRDQPSYFCHAEAQAGYAGDQLRLQSLRPRCSDGSASAPGVLECQADGEAARCHGSEGEAWTVRLYRVR